MRPIILVVGGSDPTGGAGIEADLQTVREAGGHGLAVATALTVQDTGAVHDVIGLPAEVVARRLEVLLADVTPAAIKTGMLADAGIVAAVADSIPAGVPLVVDPVLRSSSGAELLDSRGMEVLLERLLGRASVVTPNVAEARRLLGRDGDVTELAEGLVALGARAAIVTGGDAEGDDVVDVLSEAGDTVLERAPRLPGPSPHGTGCAFATALAVAMARGAALRDAFEFARLRVRRAISTARQAPGSSGRPLLGLGDVSGDDD